MCSQLIDVRACEHCGDGHAHIEMHPDCDVRGCAWCGRARVLELREELDDAAARIPDMVHARGPDLLARAELAEREAAATAAYWEGERVRAAQKLDLARDEGRLARARTAFERAALCSQRRDAAAGRAGRARRTQAALAGWRSWSWKLITVSPPWNPNDKREYEPARMRARAADAFARFAKVWDAGLGVEGAAAAFVSLECSAHGHIHVHALVYCPFTVKSWMQSVAGCHLDVRQVTSKGDGDGATLGLSEAIKYQLKVPSVTSAEWVAGKRLKVPHVQLAARWCIALRRFRTLRTFGLAVDALAATRAGKIPGESHPPQCGSCGADLSDAYVLRQPVGRIARALGTLSWEARLEFSRARSPPS